MDVFEIYTKHPETGVRGWSIVWVETTCSLIDTYPNFDRIISVNDMPIQFSKEELGVVKWEGV